MSCTGGYRREDAEVAVEHRGTYLGPVEKLPYLKELGIAVGCCGVLFRPGRCSPGRRGNVWGYGPELVHTAPWLLRQW